jgi:hypothetical protein
MVWRSVVMVRLESGSEYVSCRYGVPLRLECVRVRRGAGRQGKRRVDRY